MSVKSMGLGMVAAVLAASLAACGQSQQQSNPTSSAGASSPASSNISAAGAMLMVQPATVDGCKPNQPIVATVSWHSSAQKNQVMVFAPGQATPRLFSESGYRGSAQTGDWVVNGTKFALTDASNGHVLAEQTVSMTQCSGADH